MGAGLSPLLAAYALRVHFNMDDPTWLTEPAFLPLFYPDSYWTFFYFYLGYFIRIRNLVSGLIALIVVLPGTLGLGFGIQHLIYSSGVGVTVKDAPTVAVFSMAFAFSAWFLLQYAVSFLSIAFQGLIVLAGKAIIEPVVRIVVTILILAFALSGFLFLQPYQATLWLLFWIIAYPVALSFTRGEPLKGASLVQIYVAGLKQVPVVGQIFGASMGKPPVNSPSKDQDQSGVSDKPSDKT